jgi:hypothetical protein
MYVATLYLSASIGIQLPPNKIASFAFLPSMPVILHLNPYFGPNTVLAMSFLIGIAMMWLIMLVVYRISARHRTVGLLVAVACGLTHAILVRPFWSSFG